MSTNDMTLRIHSILYLNEPDRIAQTIEHLDRAADHAISKGCYSSVRLTYGDCSPKPVFNDDQLQRVREGIYALERFEYRFFDENHGSALGHNTLLEGAEGEDILIINPDIMLAPTAIVELARCLADAKVGMAEAKQLPVEHPKQYDAVTGETSWAATACTLIRGKVASALNGFDHKSFFLYCDDVDFSWRVRLAGYKVVYAPSACAFHDKRLGSGGKWIAGAAERFYSAEAALLLAYKYSRPDLTERWLNEFEASGDENFLRAAASFHTRKEASTLPEPLDPEHRVATFIDGNYAPHRFTL
ncbi:MAG: glycosyltransferase family 2 protein [Luteimonas sp.]